MVMLFDTLKALTLLDSLGIIHRDIKPENVLLKEDSFKLGDLGLSRLCQSGSKLTNNIGNKLGRSP
jgi:serine/threonine protein kinase